MDQGKDQLSTHAGSQQVRANIDLTRQAMDRTIDAIEGKLTPGQLLLEGLSLLRSGGASGANKIVELAREHPVPAAVIGVGVGMMIREASQKKEGNGGRAGYRAGYGYGAPTGGYAEAGGYAEPGTYGYEGTPGYRYGAAGGVRAYGYDDGPESGSRLRETAGSVGHAASAAKEKVTEAAHQAREAVSGSVHEARETVAEAAHTAKDTVAGAAQSARETVAGAASTARETVSEAAHAAREKVAGAVDTARETAREGVNRLEERATRFRERAHVQVRDAKIGFWQTLDQEPLMMGAAAVAVGLVAGLLIPSTRREDEMLGERRDEMVSRAQERGREVLEKGKQVAQTAVQTLKTEAEQQGLTPQAIAEKAKAVGRDTLEQVKSEAKKEGLVPEATGSSASSGSGGSTGRS
jgi:vacuolar-type H+-ATPase subunit H